jgi:UDP:flavonoid glycosyltransferase YjiC (YdhE family)
MALAAGLRSAGHDVTLAVTHVTNKDYTALGGSFGIPVRQVGRLDPDLAKHAGEALAGETNVLKQVAIIARELFEPAAQDMLVDAKRLCRENDLLIGHFLVHPLKTAAELAGKPYVSVFLAPLLPSAHFPPPGVPHLGKVLNPLLWKIGGLIMDRMFLPPVNAMRRAEGLSGFKYALHGAFLSPRLNLVASSPSLFPRPADWDDTIQLCGAFHLWSLAALQDVVPSSRPISSTRETGPRILISSISPVLSTIWCFPNAHWSSTTAGPERPMPLPVRGVPRSWSNMRRTRPSGAVFFIVQA